MEARYSKRGVFVEGDFVSVRYDLMPEPSAPGGTDSPFDGKRQADAASAACKALRNALEAAGYTVNRCLAPVYSLYVVELAAGCLGPATRRVAGDLYVGQTSKTVAERIQEHLKGNVGREGKRPLHSRVVHKHYVCTRQDLIPVTFPPALFCQEQSLRAESILRLCLERNGYRVNGGQERYDDVKAAVAGRDPGDALLSLVNQPAFE
jgi:hypothetical protein